MCPFVAFLRKDPGSVKRRFPEQCHLKQGELTVIKKNTHKTNRKLQLDHFKFCLLNPLKYFNGF